MAAAAAAAALSAFVVPGLFDAELKLPNRLLSCGAGTAGRGRGAADAAAALPFRPGLEDPFDACTGFAASLRFEVTTIFLVAGWMLFSVSRARLEPTASAGESLDDGFAVWPSLPAFALLCFLFVDADALSTILWAISLLEGPPFLINLGRILVRLVFCNNSSSTVMKRSKS